MSDGDYVAWKRIHGIVLILQFRDMCQSLCSKTPLNSLYSYENLRRLEKYSGIHVHPPIKRAVKAPFESNHKSIELFINYSRPHSFLSILSLYTASVSPKGYFSAGASDFQNLSEHLDLDCLFDAQSWYLVSPIISHHQPRPHHQSWKVTKVKTQVKISHEKL